MRNTAGILPLMLLAACRQGGARTAAAPGGRRAPGRKGPAANATSHGRPAAVQMGGKRAIVFTTADSTAYRLSPTDTLVFKPSEPTSEAKAYVFVDPRRTFQPLIGIGGGLTDAAAETFAKLPAARQETLMAGC